MRNITRTFLRTDETMDKYIKFMQSKSEDSSAGNNFDNEDERIVKEFKYWRIIENKFPYDAIATISHMIIPKRSVSFDWKLLNKEEEQELEELQDTYMNDHYDVIWENLAKGRTIPGRFHLHLLVLKREEV